jgi:hypothetical protein
MREIFANSVACECRIGREPHRGIALSRSHRLGLLPGGCTTSLAVGASCSASWTCDFTHAMRRAGIDAKPAYERRWRVHCISDHHAINAGDLSRDRASRADRSRRAPARDLDPDLLGIRLELRLRMLSTNLCRAPRSSLEAHRQARGPAALQQLPARPIARRSEPDRRRDAGGAGRDGRGHRDPLVLVDGKPHRRAGRHRAGQAEADDR